MRAITFPFGTDSLVLNIEITEPRASSPIDRLRSTIDYGDERSSPGLEWKISVPYSEDLTLVAELASREAFHVVDRLGREWQEPIHGEMGARIVQAVVHECMLAYKAYNTEPIDIELREL